MQSTIFYSWQSDLPNNINRGFIEEALKNTAKKLNTDDSISVDFVVDRDTQNVPGSPDIASTIFEKIDACDVFACDVSIINSDQQARLTPNPNVLLELGYAVKRLGWNRIILIYNTAFAPVEALPFDLRPRKIYTYEVKPDATEKATERRNLESKLNHALQGIYTLIQNSIAQNAVVQTEPSIEDLQWQSNHQKVAITNLNALGFRTHVELFAVPLTSTETYKQDRLRNVALDSMIETFGWPIGLMDINAPGMVPRPAKDGIITEITRKGEGYDYWSIRNDGALYLAKTIFEDKDDTNQIFFNIRIVRTAEMLMYLSNLYTNLGVPSTTKVWIRLRYNGLKGRHLSNNGRRLFHSRATAEENEVETTLLTDVTGLTGNITNNVMHLLSPLFMLFDYFSVDRSTYEKIITAFQQGQVT